MIENSANLNYALSGEISNDISVLVQSSEKMSVVISVKRNYSSFKNEFHVSVLIWVLEHILKGLSGNWLHVVEFLDNRNLSSLSFSWGTLSILNGGLVVVVVVQPLERLKKFLFGRGKGFS